jgi:hypothetical protein
MIARTAKVASAGLAIVIAVAALGCGAQEDPPELGVIDHTGSSWADSAKLCEQDLGEYARARYVSVMGARGELRIGLFDSTTAADPTFPAQGKFEVPAQDQSNPGKTVEDLKGELSEFHEKVTGMLTQAGSSHGGTDLVTMLTSLGDAARAVGAKRLWICSDADDNRLIRPITLASVAGVLGALRREHGLPDLHGLAVVFDTSSVHGRASLSGAELTGLRAWVEGLVTESGGVLAGYGPGAGTGTGTGE